MPAIAPEEQEAETFDIRTLLDIVKRRHLYFLIPMLIGWTVVWTISWILPSRYKSGTLILVQQPTMPKDYVIPNVSDNIQDRLQSITQQILSRTRLLLIIDQLNLYATSPRNMTPDEKVDQMRKDIDIELVRDPREAQITAFNIYYSAKDPHVAQQVTGELSKLFINANLEVRQQQSEGTTKFLESQLDNARTNLAEQEAKIREFKGAHMGDLPSQQASNLQILSGLQQQLGNEQDAIHAAEQQRVYLQTLIDQYKSMQPARTADGFPEGLPAIDKQLDQLKAQLADLSSRYTDSYPDIRNLKIQIAKTEKIRDSIIAGMKNKVTDTQSNGKTANGSPIDITLNPAVLQLQGQLHANESEIANRQQAIETLKSKIAEYQGRLNQEPVTEQQMADLTRGYDQSQANYDDLLRKKNQSEMATSMELLQQGERFSILDPPSLPLKPDFPNRVKFCGIGIGVGLALGVVVAGWFELMDDRMYSEKEIKKALSMVVMTEIPEILGDVEGKTRQRQALLGWAVAFVVAIAIIAGSAFNYIHS